MCGADVFHQDGDGDIFIGLIDAAEKIVLAPTRGTWKEGEKTLHVSNGRRG